MRVLVCSESSLLNTGYGVMTAEICRRLAALGFEVAELAQYAQAGDPRLEQIPWRVYPVVPHPDDKDGMARHESDPHNQFGRAMFNQALLHFRPAYVWNGQDPWYQTHIVLSPLRSFFRYLYVPTVDASPQKADWLEAMGMADAVGTYTEWANAILEKEGGGSLPLVGPTPLGVDHGLFRPYQDKAGLRQAFGIPEDALVVGFVSRNQVRKRFPELFGAFRRFLDTAPEKVASRAQLYLHTSWPDIGWDIPGLLRDSGVSARTWFTYHCRDCGHGFASRWADGVTLCPRCGQGRATLPSAKTALPRDFLPLIYNLFDAYVQYANSEGVGLGILEAGACGVPVLGTDYSGMASAVRHLEGWPVGIRGTYREVETGLERAIPCEDSFCRALAEVLSLPEPVRRARGALARDGVMRHYDWDTSVRKMAEVLLAMPPAEPWDSPPCPFSPERNWRKADGLSNADFVRWGFHAIAGRPELSRTTTAQRMVRELDWGARLNGLPYFSDETFLGRSRHSVQVTRETLAETWLGMAAERNHWENERCKLTG